MYFNFELVMNTSYVSFIFIWVAELTNYWYKLVLKINANGPEQNMGMGTNLKKLQA